MLYYLGWALIDSVRNAKSIPDFFFRMLGHIKIVITIFGTVILLAVTGMILYLLPGAIDVLYRTNFYSKRVWAPMVVVCDVYVQRSMNKLSSVLVTIPVLAVAILCGVHTLVAIIAAIIFMFVIYRSFNDHYDNGVKLMTAYILLNPKKLQTIPNTTFLLGFSDHTEYEAFLNSAILGKKASPELETSFAKRKGIAEAIAATDEYKKFVVRLEAILNKQKTDVELYIPLLHGFENYYSLGKVERFLTSSLEHVGDLFDSITTKEITTDHVLNYVSYVKMCARTASGADYGDAKIYGRHVNSEIYLSKLVECLKIRKQIVDKVKANDFNIDQLALKSYEIYQENSLFWWAREPMLYAQNALQKAYKSSEAHRLELIREAAIPEKSRLELVKEIKSNDYRN